MERAYKLEFAGERAGSLYVSCCGLSKTEPLHSFGPAQKPYYLIHYILRGKGRFSLRNKEFQLSSGNGFLIPPEELSFYQADEKEPWTYIWVGFQGEMAERILQNIGLTVVNPVFCSDHSEELYQAVKDMMEHNTYGISNDLRRNGQLQVFLSVIADGVTTQEHGEVDRADHYVERAIAYIRSNYCNPIRVTDVADYVCVNRSYLYTLFKNALDMSPQQFLTNYRVHKAMELLRTTELPVESIALSCGYTDPQVFTKAFKHVKRISPSGYRKEVRTGEINKNQDYLKQIEGTLLLKGGTMMKEQLLAKFGEVFGSTEGAAVYFAPGRVNLIGEHTDYNGGFVFPGAVDKGMIAEIKPNGTDKVRAYSIDLKDYVEFGLNEEDAPKASWARYIFGVCREMIKRGVDVKGFDTAFAGDVPLGAGMSSSAALESTYAFAINELFGDNKIDKFELAKVGQATEHNYCGVNCGIMDQFASVFGKEGSLIRLDCRSLEYQYFPFKPEGYRLVLVDSVVKHELASSAYNKRRQSCEAAVAAIQKKHPHVEFLRDCTMEMLQEAKAEISEEDYMRAEYVIEEIQRVLDVCDALERGDYETVGQKMYETHYGMSKLYEVSCEELDFLNDVAFDCGVTGSRVMGGGFGGCTINLVKNELYETFITTAKERFKEKFGRSPKVYDVVISDGSRKLV